MQQPLTQVLVCPPVANKLQDMPHQRPKETKETKERGAADPGIHNYIMVPTNQDLFFVRRSSDQTRQGAVNQIRMMLNLVFNAESCFDIIPALSPLILR